MNADELAALTHWARAVMREAESDIAAAEATIAEAQRRKAGAAKFLAAAVDLPELVDLGEGTTDGE